MTHEWLKLREASSRITCDSVQRSLKLEIMNTRRLVANEAKSRAQSEVHQQRLRVKSQKTTRRNESELLEKRKSHGTVPFAGAIGGNAAVV